MKSYKKKFSFVRIKQLVQKNWLKEHTHFIDLLPKSQTSLWIVLASALGLFAELMIIRVHSSYFQLFAYFKNISMLSCFLGLGIGYAIGSKKPLYTPLVLPLFAIQIMFMHILSSTSISSFLQNPISEQLSLGLSQAGTYKQLFIYFFVVFIFLLNAITFIPLGQLTSHLMDKKSLLSAYGWNLLGSLLGTILFSLLSLIWSPPLVWFLITTMILLLFVYKEKISILTSVFFVSMVVIILSFSPKTNQYNIFSPYQVLTLSFYKETPPILMTNNSYYQKILDLRPQSIAENPALKTFEEYYSIPYKFKPNPENVLIVGSGTGNDVAAAIRNGAGKIDAVEIDPAILNIGTQLHPESPYQNPKVVPIVNDARAFLRYTNNKYDLIVYGLLDSHTLLSGRSGIRLDSYVYTVEAFKEARSKLKDGGAICLTFALMKGELGKKIYLMLQEAFDGRPPVVYYSQYDGGYTFLAGDKLKNISTISSFKNVTDFFSDKNLIANVSTDDWPFFYMPLRTYPISSVTLIFILFLVSLFLIRNIVKRNQSGFSLPCFFLGAGFMLLETKGITELALNYGSTWYVNSIVIICILLMGFMGNLYVMRKGISNRKLFYFLLFISILISLGFTYTKPFTYSQLVNKIVMPISLTLPLFFSGIVFSSELKKTASISVALYSNLLGAMLGGFLEYNSMYFGFRSLYIIALIMYIIAFIKSAK